MLQITVRGKEVFNEATSEFYYPNETTLNLEHSLISISKWEEKWHKPFISKFKHTDEETRDYIRCMVIGQNVDPNVIHAMESDEIEEVINYIEDSHSAIHKSKDQKGGSREDIPSERIYYWMFSYRIPKECEKWHISRLLNLIEIFNDANTPTKKHSKADRNNLTKSWASLNEQRKRAMHTRG